MPDVATARTRDVTISGTGSFGLDSLSTFGGPTIFHRVMWFAVSEVDYWGKSVSANISVTEGGATPSVTLRILYGGFTKSVTVGGTSHAGATFFTSQDAGSFSFTEVVHCVEHVNPNPYEVMTGVSFTCSASISVHFTDTTNGGGSQTVSASLTMTHADIAGFASETYTPYQYTFTFTGVAVHFDLAATIGFDQPGLISASTGIDTHLGKPELRGNGGAMAWHWDGIAGDVNPGWAGSSQPQAIIRFAPSWAMSVGSAIYHYKDGSEVGATINHYYGTDLVGSFASGSSYRYPASGMIDYVVLDTFLSGANSAGTGFQSGHPADYTLAGSSYGPIGALLQKPGDPAGASTAFRVDPAWANGYGTYIKSSHPTPNASSLLPKLLPSYTQGSVAWADTHRFALFEDTGPNTKLTANTVAGSTTDLPVLSTDGWNVGDPVTIGAEGVIISAISTGHLTVGATGVSHPKGAAVVRGYLGTTVEGARWSGSSSLFSFSGATAPIDAAPSVHKVSGIGIDGFAVEVATVGQAVVDASLRYLFLHQAYRYAQLRVKASPLTTTLSGGVSSGGTDLPVANSDGFLVGDAVIVDSSGTVETVGITAVATGHLTVAALTHNHSSGVSVAKSGAIRALFALSGTSVGAIGWLITLPTDGVMQTIDLDLAIPQYEVLIGATVWQPSVRLVHPDLFISTPSGGYFGATVQVQPLDAGTFTFDYLEGQLKTTGTRTPRVLFPFLDGLGDAVDLTFYEASSGRALPSGLIGQRMTWMVNGVRGATVRPVGSTSAGGDWQWFKTWYDSATSNPQSVSLGFPKPNDTGITVTPGVLGVSDPLSVFGSTNQGVFEFDTTDGYGIKATSHTFPGRLRPSSVSAYYGAGDLTAASGGYSAVVAFTLDWLFDGEVITTIPGATAGGSPVVLADNDAGTVLDSAVPDDDGMARLRGKYGVVHPNSNTDDSVQWSIPSPVSTTLTGSAFSGATDLPVASTAGFSVGDSILIGFSGGSAATITAIAPGHFTITPAITGGGHLSGEPVTGPTPPLAYTTLGKLLNSDWLSGDISPTDAGGYLVAGSPPAREDVVILDRYQAFITVPGGGGLLGLANLETHLGRYFVAWPDKAAGIRVSRSDFTTPPFAAAATGILVTSDPADREPCLMIRPSGSPHEPERLRLLYQRSGQVYARESDDGGETWDVETAMSIPGGKHPRGAYGAANERVEAAVVGANIQGTVQYPGDAAPSAPATFVDSTGTALTVENDTFDLDSAHEGEERIVMFVRIQGESAPSSWASAAYDYSTWERVS